MKRILFFLFSILLLTGCHSRISEPDNIPVETNIPVTSGTTESNAMPSGSIENLKTPASNAGDENKNTPAVSSPISAVPVIELEGTINCDINIHMSLEISDGVVKGTYYYDKFKTSINLLGATDDNKGITINEYASDGQIIGTFQGWYVQGIGISGDWTNIRTNEVLPFDLKVIDGIPRDAIWSGEWNRLNANGFYGATLYIINETETQFEFDEIAVNGGYSGEIAGTAIIQGNCALYEDDNTGASLTFSLDAGSGIITLEANDSANSLAGASVEFDGQFTKREILDNFTLLSSGYVKTEQQENEFKDMVGDDLDLFLDTAQIANEANDLDGLGAIVNIWWVRGIAPYNASIVMFLPDGKLCAAANDLNDNTVKVYTNASYLISVPKTITKWNEDHLDWNIIFIKK